MRAIQTDDCNVNLTLPGGTGDNDLPAQRCYFTDPHDTIEQPPQLGFETTWLPDEREREAIGAGAPVLLRVWGAGHPPVNLAVPAVEEARQAITADHAARAIGWLYGKLADDGRMDAIAVTDADELTAPKLLALWQQAVDATSELAMQVDTVVDELIDSLDEPAAAPPSDPDTSEPSHPQVAGDLERRCNCPPATLRSQPTDDQGNCPACGFAR